MATPLVLRSHSQTDQDTLRKDGLAKSSSCASDGNLAAIATDLYQPTSVTVQQFKLVATPHCMYTACTFDSTMACTAGHTA